MGKRLLQKYAGYVHAKQFKRSKKAINKLKTYLGRVYREIKSKVIEPSEKLKELLIIA